MGQEQFVSGRYSQWSTSPNRKGHGIGVNQQDEKQNDCKTLGIVSEVVKTAGEAKAGMMTDLVNQIIAEGVIPGECEICTSVNVCKEN